MAVWPGLAPGQEASSGPQVKLTCLKHDETISRHASFPITWTAVNIEGNTALSLRLQWTDQVPSGGVLRSVESNRLIGEVLDAKSEEKFAALSRSTPQSAPESSADMATIESGKYLWDANTFCRENTSGGRSVCEPGVRYRLQIILRSADDPCADNLHCAKPRLFFKVLVSDGGFTFRD
jgi:hypothetical protein